MHLLIVSGLSGAGKSLCLNCLEEQGYFCTDNLPSPLLSDFVRLCSEAEDSLKAAVTLDSRESFLKLPSESIVQSLRALRVPYEILYLDARDEVLRMRYNETRRRHPLADDGDTAAGIRREREYLRPIRARATHVLDTSDIPAKELSRALSKLLPEYGSPEMSLLFSSFGYKRGVPVDADMVFDMRFLPNPYYVDALRSQTGLDAPVRDFVLTEEYAAEFLNRAETLIADTLPRFVAMDKRILRVCFGCTGGRHRSVVAAEEMARRFRLRDAQVRVYHRDIDF